MGKLRIPHQLSIAISPKEADLAFVSTDLRGNPGALNRYVLSEYGYGIADIPPFEQLMHGFGAIHDHNGKPILFVVTIEARKNTESALETNLYNTFVEFRGWLEGKKNMAPANGNWRRWTFIKREL